MIDYIKIHHLPIVEDILSNPLLTFPMSHISTVGEVLHRAQVAHLKGLQFVHRGENTALKGSLHKYYHCGENWQDFAVNDVKTVIDDIALKFSFDPAEATINFIEIGVNLRVDRDPSELIKCLIMHKTKPFETLPVKGKGYGRKCENQQITIKVYNKSLQYNLDFHLLRYEVKIKRIAFLEQQYSLPKITMQDLQEVEIYKTFTKMLFDVWAGVVLFNPEVDPESMNIKDRLLFTEGKYPAYWQNLDRYKRHRYLKKFI